ncbi:MAG: hypothetical protein AB8G11_05310 [Saprospiraceae bacterium]
MAKWEKLDNELLGVLENMSSETWQLWQANRERNKALRLEQQKLAAELHLKQLELKEQIQVFSEGFVYWNDLKLEDIFNTGSSDVKNAGNNNNYAMAA